MRKLFLSFLFILLICSLHAQHFSESPESDRPVRQIVEWTTFPADGKYEKETVRDIVYHFRRDGQLSSMILNDLNGEERYYSYDVSGRLEEVLIKNNNGSTIMTYRYQPGLKIAEIKNESIHLKNMQYLDNGGRVLEEKEYVREAGTGGEMTLLFRKLFNYNDRGDVFGEITYTYDKGKEHRKKTVHHYDPSNNRKSRTIVMEKDDRVVEEIIYQYDQDGRPVAVEYRYPEKKTWRKTKFLYKDGEVWQEITNYSSGDRTEKVFLDGKLIRSKEYIDGVLEWYTDFQYLYYD